MRRRLSLLVLSGPTREYIDPVRYISNASSGRQGRELAAEARRRGHFVDLVEGPVSLADPDDTEGVTLHKVTTAREMLDTARVLHPASDALVGVAAVTDYRPASRLEAKKKRDAKAWHLQLVPTDDILLELGKSKGTRIHVGFALETEHLLENACDKLHRKNLDWLVGNSPAAIGSEEGEYVLVSSDGTCRELGCITKTQLAVVLLDVIESSVLSAHGPGARSTKGEGDPAR